MIQFKMDHNTIQEPFAKPGSLSCLLLRVKGGYGGLLPHQKTFSSLMLVVVGYLLVRYATHCNWVSDEAYSSPSIVLISGWGPHRHVMDDFREAYYWLRHNTASDAKIMSW
jgi:hypothetical protein